MTSLLGPTYNILTVLSIFNIDDGPFTIEELRKSKNLLKQGKMQDRQHPSRGTDKLKTRQRIAWLLQQSTDDKR